MFTHFKSQLDLQAELHLENLIPSKSYVMLEAGNIRNIVSFFSFFLSKLTHVVGPEDSKLSSKSIQAFGCLPKKQLFSSCPLVLWGAAVPPCGY